MDVRILLWTKDFIQAEINVTDKALDYIHKKFKKNEKGEFVSTKTIIKIDKKISIFTTHSYFDQHFLELF